MNPLLCSELADNEEQPATLGYMQAWNWVLQPVDISMAERKSIARWTTIQSSRCEVSKIWDTLRGISDEIRTG